MNSRKYSQDDLEADLYRLRCILDEVSFMLVEMPRTGDKQQDFIDAIIYMARELAIKVCNKIAEMPARSLGEAPE